MSNLTNEGFMPAALDWDSEIEQDSSYIVLPEGDYDFRIQRYEKTLFDGSDKVPPCPKAIVYFDIIDPETKTTVQLKDNYLLVSNLEWKLSELFKSVGLKEEGQKVKMAWDELPGLTGRCRVVQKPGVKDPTKMYNQIDKLYAKPKAAYKAGKF